MRSSQQMTAIAGGAVVSRASRLRFQPERWRSSLAQHPKGYALGPSCPSLATLTTTLVNYFNSLYSYSLT